MNDYEAEILQMRSEMEQLQVKLSEAERQLQFNNQRADQDNSSQRDPAKEVVDRLLREEDKLRREHLDLVTPEAPASAPAEGSLSDKEKMILMQQKKIAALDAANRRLLEELNRMTVTTAGSTSSTSSSASSSSPATALSSPSKVSVTPINVTSINTSSNTVSHDRRVSSSSTSSNKSITVITNGEATCCTTSTSATSPASNVKSSNSNSLPAQPAGSQEIPKRVEELLDSLHSTSI